MTSVAEVELKTLEDQFKEQLDEFLTGEDDYSKYSKYEPIGPKVLVKLFKFTPMEADDALGKQMIMVPDPLNRGKYKPSTVALNEKIFPIVKVIRKGSGDWGASSVAKDSVKVGDAYVVPYNDVVGMKINPDFLHMMQTYKGKTGSQGSLIKVTDEMDVPQNLPALDINWARYKFSLAGS